MTDRAAAANNSTATTSIAALHADGLRAQGTYNDRPRSRPARSHHGFRHLESLSKQLSDELQSIDPALTVDLGCGSKPYRPLVRGDYVGLDLTAIHGEPDAVGAAESTPLVSECAAVVLSTQQLEHVDDPIAVLCEAYRIPRPGCTLLLSTHGVWPHHPDPQDLWRWTEEGLIRIVEVAGFRLAKVHRHGELFTTALFLATYPIGGIRRQRPALARLFAALLLVALNSVCAPLDWLSSRSRRRHFVSPSYLVVERRPVQPTD